MIHLRRFLVLTVILILCGFCGSVSAEAVLEKIPMDLKESSPDMSYTDDEFMEIADNYLESLSGHPVPVGIKSTEIYGNYLTLRNKNISPDLYQLGMNIVAYLFYTAEAGEAYKEFLQVKNGYSSVTDPMDYYDLAADYKDACSYFIKNIETLYPDAGYEISMWTLPEPDSDTTLSILSGTYLKGLSLPVSMVMKESGSATPDVNEDLKTTFVHWIEDNVDEIASYKAEGTTNGTAFMSGDGMKETKFTWMGLMTKSVGPEFYDTANNIAAFFFFLNKAEEYYNDYLTNLNSVSGMGDLSTPFKQSQQYFSAAGEAFDLIKADIPEIENSSLPKFPEIDEVKSRFDTLQTNGLGNYADSTSLSSSFT